MAAWINENTNWKQSDDEQSDPPINHLAYKNWMQSWDSVRLYGQTDDSATQFNYHTRGLTGAAVAVGKSIKTLDNLSCPFR